MLPAAPNFPSVSSTFDGAQYSPKGELKVRPLLLHVGSSSFERTITAAYDALGALISREIVSAEGFGARAFTYNFNRAAGTMTRIGPDGVETFVQFDPANRVSSLRRGPEADPILTATYTYKANRLLELATFGNGAKTVYTYDNAHRVRSIDHRNASNVRILELEYAYTPNNLVDGITERDASGVLATVTFEYDTRGRLTREERADVVDPSRSFDLTYVYDAGGNRRVKLDAVNNREVQYHYDIDDPVTYGSNNNRLMFVETYDTSGDPALLETTWYYYTLGGNVERVVARQENGGPTDPEFTAVRLGYGHNAQTVTYVLGETWDTDQLGNPSDYSVTFAREFRYDRARARYLNRELDPLAVIDDDFTTYLSTTWSDYDDDEIYGDFADGGAPVRSYETGVAVVETWVSTGSASTQYIHRDLIDTLRRTTDAEGNSGGLRVMTAFGEPVFAQGDRFGYAGYWGYQAHTDFPFLHVGHRYYDPSTGRFIQRDPIGLLGGQNHYAYVSGRPTVLVDPLGLQQQGDEQHCHDACGVWAESGAAAACPADPLLKCTTACGFFYWPPAPAPPQEDRPPKDTYEPWPGPCPPSGPPSGGGGGSSGCGGGGGGGAGGAAGFILPFFVMLTWRSRQWRRLTK